MIAVHRRLPVVFRRLAALGYKSVAESSLPGWPNARIYRIREHQVLLAWEADGRWTVLAPISAEPDTEATFEALEMIAAF